MSVTLEPKLMAMRSGEYHLKHGDNYDFAASVFIHDNVAIVYQGVGKPPKRSDVIAALKEYGVKTVRWERIVDGVTSYISRDI